MRSIAFVLGMSLALVACKQATKDPVGGDDQPGVDGPIDPDAPPPPVNGFQIITPDIDITPGQEVTYCYYFHIATTSGQDVAIKQWKSHMTTGSHHMILFTNGSNSQPDGTLTTANCGLTGGGGLNIPTWTYSAQTPDAEANLPTDDGAGKPVAQIVANGQAAFIQMHYLNTTDDTLHAHVQLDAIGYDPGTAITQAAPFVTFNTQINIPAGSAADPSTASAAGSCTVSPTAKFYVMTTHSHKQTHETFVKDGGTVSGNAINGGSMVVDSTDWEHPLVQNWNAMPFYQFSSGKLSYQCNYSNPNTYAIHEGDSAATDEMCMAVGYFFPGTSAKLCLNSFSVN